jgi:hypothetical protein
VYEVQCLVARTRRVQTRVPSVWDAWCAGDIDGEQVRVIDQTLRRLVTDEAVFRLDLEVVDAALAMTTSQLTGWLHRFVAHTEPEHHRHRQIRAFADRYASARQGLDGVGFVTAMGSAADVAAVDQRLTDLAQARRAHPAGAHTSIAQRRSDALFDLLLDRRPHDCGAASTGAVSTVIGVVVPVASLVGDSCAPGELLDRSATIPATVIRGLAQQPDTLFYRLLTDPAGHLLDVAELGRYPSTRLGWATDFRAGTCIHPTCTVPATRCDHDHHIPHPGGETAGWNTDPQCRHHHRAKTHAGFTTTRAGPHIITRTPTGHIHARTDQPLPIGRPATEAETQGGTRGDGSRRIYAPTLARPTSLPARSPAGRGSPTP